MYLYLHPATEVIPKEICSDWVQHVNLVGLEGDSLLVEVVPGAADLPGLVPDLLQQRVVLDDHRVLDEGALQVN